MRPRLLSRCAPWLLVCWIALSSLASAADTGRPNVLLIVADDQRWDTVRALGNGEIQTPNLDALVQRGFHFTNAYCMGSMTPAVCLPSRAMLITGRSLWHIPDNPRAKEAPPGVPLLPKAMSAAGYVTFHCGKIGNSCTFANAAFDTNIETKGRTADSATEMGQEAVDFIARHDLARPLFMYLAPQVPHDPRLAPEKFVRMYDPSRLTLSKNFMPQHPFDNGELQIRDELLAPHPRMPDVMRQHLAEYYATITHFDDEIGRVLAALAQRGMADNTIVIFTSDQGLAVGGRHGLMGKQNLYEHFKSPLVVAGPGIPPGKSEALVYLFDLFPTICDLAGAATPAAVEGKSLVGVMRSKQSRVRDSLFCAYRACQRMVRDERWKLTAYDASGVLNTQLFDLAADPDELRNLADDPRHAAERRRLTALMEKSRREYGDPVEFKMSALPGGN